MVPPRLVDGLFQNFSWTITTLNAASSSKTSARIDRNRDIDCRNSSNFKNREWRNFGGLAVLYVFQWLGICLQCNVLLYEILGRHNCVVTLGHCHRSTDRAPYPRRPHSCFSLECSARGAVRRGSKWTGRQSEGAAVWKGMKSCRMLFPHAYSLLSTILFISLSTSLHERLRQISMPSLLLSISIFPIWASTTCRLHFPGQFSVHTLKPATTFLSFQIITRIL